MQLPLGRRLLLGVLGGPPEGACGLSYARSLASELLPLGVAERRLVRPLKRQSGRWVGRRELLVWDLSPLLGKARSSDPQGPQGPVAPGTGRTQGCALGIRTESESWRLSWVLEGALGGAGAPGGEDALVGRGAGQPGLEQQVLIL